MKHIIITTLFALTAGTAFAGQGNNQLPPGANPGGNGIGCLDNPGVGCGPRPSPVPPPVPVPTPVPNPNHNHNHNHTSGTSNSSAEAAAQASATANLSASQHIDGSAGNNRLSTGDSSATSKSGVEHSGNSDARATGNGAGNVTTSSETTVYEAAKLPPQLPAVFLTMSAPCMGSAGGGAGSGVTVINLSFTYSDDECKDIRRVMTLAGGFWSMNMRYSAFTVLCSFAKFKETIPTCSQPFPVDDPKQLWGYNPIDALSQKARAEKAEAELAKLKNIPAAPLLSGITKDDLNELKASLAAATVRVEVPTDKVGKKRVKCKMEEFTNSAGKKITMCPGPNGSYEITTVTREKAVGTTTGNIVHRETEQKK